jgi:uncharacterized SAM-binding protein YcdF (DUF218 family)
MKVVAVLGYSDRSAALHAVCASRVALAGSLVAAGDTVILSGWARTAGGVPEAELMRRSWPGPACELIVDPSPRSTAENADAVTALARRLGAREVVVVTSWWHRLRAGVFFRARAAGLPVTIVAAGHPTPVRLLVREAAAFLLAPVQLAASARRRDG